jgi:hypothetical protein
MTAAGALRKGVRLTINWKSVWHEFKRPVASQGAFHSP